MLQTTDYAQMFNADPAVVKSAKEKYKKDSDFYPPLNEVEREVALDSLIL